MNRVVNVDYSEVNKFNALAQMWWDPKGPMAMLHTINPLRSNFIIQNASIAGCKVLDVGCGAGLLTEALSKAGASLTGIDLTEKTLAVAKQHAMSEKLDINYFNEDIEEFAEKNSAAFDTITCLEVLEHVPDPQRVIQACVKLLRPGGHLFISTINRTLKARLFAIIGAEYILKILPKGTHSYKKFIRHAELLKMAEQNGLAVTKISSFIYNPFSKTFKIKNGADVNYIVCFELNIKKAHSQ